MLFLSTQPCTSLLNVSLKDYKGHSTASLSLLKPASGCGMKLKTFFQNNLIPNQKKNVYPHPFLGWTETLDKECPTNVHCLDAPLWENDLLCVCGFPDMFGGITDF